MHAGGPFGPVGPVATYSAGQVVAISLLITANHGGRHAFRLCGRSDSLDEACFAAHVLQRQALLTTYPGIPVTASSVVSFMELFQLSVQQC